jgi:hypothetical protein
MTVIFYKKYVWGLIMIMLLLWIVLIPSPFQKGGIAYELNFIIPLFVGVISLLINLLIRNSGLLESVFIAFLFAFISLFITSFIIVPPIVEFFYGDRTWSLWEIKNRIFINTIYYGLNTIILILLTSIYLKIRKKLKVTAE